MTPALKRILRSTAVRISLLVLAVLLAAWLIVPQMLTLHYQSRAGLIMETVIQREASDYQDHFACLLPVLNDMPEDAKTEIAQSVTLLKRASRVTPNNTYTYMMLGKAYCLTQNYEQAIESLEAYHQKRPKNPLGLMEKGFAYFSWAQMLDEDQEGTRITYLDRSILALEEASIGGALLAHHGDIAYRKADYKTAWVWYQLAGTFSALPDEVAIKVRELNLMFGIEPLNE